MYWNYYDNVTGLAIASVNREVSHHTKKRMSIKYVNLDRKLEILHPMPVQP